MASKRMFCTALVNSSTFLKMPLSSQALYFHLGLHADDDGIVDAYSITRMVGSSEDDFRILIAKEYIVPLNDEMLIWIRHFLVNNTISPSKVISSIYRHILLAQIPDAPVVYRDKDKQEEKGMPLEMKNTMYRTLGRT